MDMVRDLIKKDLEAALGQLTKEVAAVEVTRPQDSNHGDFSTNIALKIKRVDKQSPMEFAKVLAGSMRKSKLIRKLEVKEPGFVNFFIRDEVWQKQVEYVLKESSEYGSNKAGVGKRARVEFISANPTGPLHFGNARGGPIGDVLASVLSFCGWEVLREYLDNDEGNQVFELGKSLAAKAGLITTGEDLTYKGEYTTELAEKVKHKIVIAKKSNDAIIAEAGRFGVIKLYESIIADCEAMGIEFNYIVHESQLREHAPEILSEFEKKGLLVKKDGAVWFAPRLRRGSAVQAKNEFLEDRDAVVVKSDGNYTYFTADIVYHREKFESGYDLVVDVFGSNTSGHVPKLKALAAALGFDQGKFKVILYQFVRIKRGNEVIKMSKRSGNFVTVREVLDEVGKDVLRFFILMHDPNSHMDFDLELARERSSKNPVYYVQYAHARIASILAKANINSLTGKRFSNTNYNLLTSNYELALIKKITELPELVAEISKSFAVHRLTTYAVGLADLFHKFYENCPVLESEPKLRNARLALLSATQIALKNTLSLLGVSAPEKM